MGDRDEAIKLLEQAHTLRVDHGREKTPLALTTLLNLSVTEFDAGRFEIALQHAREIHKTANELFGPKSFQALASQQLIALCALHLGRPHQAITVVEQSEDSSAPESLVILGKAELAQRNYIKAQTYFETALPNFPPETHISDDILHHLMKIASLQNDPAKVQTYYEQNRKYITVDSDGFRAAMLQLHYGHALTNLGRAQEALVHLEELRSSPPENFLTNVLSVGPQLSLALARAYRAQGNLEAAERELQSTLVQCGEARPIERANALYELGLVTEAQGSMTTAAEYIEQAQALYNATAETNFRPLVDSRTTLARIRQNL